VAELQNAGHVFASPVRQREAKQKRAQAKAKDHVCTSIREKDSRRNDCAALTNAQDGWQPKSQELLNIDRATQRRDETLGKGLLPIVVRTRRKQRHTTPGQSGTTRNRDSKTPPRSEKERGRLRGKRSSADVRAGAGGDSEK